MRNYDLEILSHFLKRPGMYTGEHLANNNRNVDKFLMAYDLGANGECNFREKLSAKIVQKFGIHMPSEGLIKQFELAANQLNIDWFELFVKEGNEILSEESEKNGKSRFAKILRDKFLKYLEEIPSEINVNWTVNWNSKVNQMTGWEGKNLSSDESNLILEISELTNKLIANDILAMQPLSNLIIEKMNNLVTLLKRNNER